MNSTEALQVVLDSELAAINARPRVVLALESVQFFMQVRDGRGPRKANGEIVARLPIIGSRDISRIGDDLDRERAELVVVFTVSGKINGLLVEGTSIWIQGDRVSLPTLAGGTPKATTILYDLGRAVRDRVVGSTELADDAWQKHLGDVLNRVAELTAYLNAVATAAKGQQTVTA